MKRVKHLTMTARLLLGLCGFVAVCLPSSIALAHGGEDHSHDAVQAEPGMAARVAVTSDQFEIVGVPTAADGGKLILYVTDFWSNRPVNGAKLDVTQGQSTQAAAVKEGRYELPAPWVLKPGSYPLTFAITAGERSDLLIGTLAIPAMAREAAHDSIWDHIVPHDFAVPRIAIMSAAALAAILLLASFFARGRMRRAALYGFVLTSTAAAGSAALALIAHADVSTAPQAILDMPESARRAPDGAIFMPKAAQALLGIETMRTETAAAAQRTRSFAGLIVTDPNKSGVVQSLLAGRIEPPESGFPAIGARVEKGAVLGYLVPRVELVDQSDIRQTTGDLDRQIKLAEAKVARFDQLKGVIAAAQIADARLELEGLRARRTAIKPVLGEREPLTAPVSGTIAQASVAAGQVVDAQATLFQIVDADSLYVEALAFDVSEAAAIEKEAKEARASTANGQKITLKFEGRALSLKQQAVPLRYRITSGGEGLGLGQPVTVSVPVEEPLKAVTVPRSSVVRAPNGQQSVLVHTAPELFEARPIASEPVDADRIGITAGLEPDVRIVWRGAELINQVR